MDRYVTGKNGEELRERQQKQTHLERVEERGEYNLPYGKLHKVNIKFRIRKEDKLIGERGEHSLLVRSTTAEEKKGNLVEKPGWFRDSSTGDLKRKNEEKIKTRR